MPKGIKHKWTDKQLSLLRKHYPVIKHTRHLEKIVHKPYNAIKAKATTLKLYRIVAHSGTPSSTRSEEKFIRNNYLNLPLKTIATMLGNGRTYTFVKSTMDRLNLMRPPELIQQIKDATRIKKGNVPPNKGKKQSEYMSRETIERTKATRFQKGQIPHNARGYKNGHISIRTDKRTGLKWKYIRLGLGKWRELHRHNYEKKFGKIPRKMCVSFHDGDHMNCEPKNLKLITMVENMQNNTIHRYPPELKTTLRVLSKLNRKIKQHEK